MSTSVERMTIGHPAAARARILVVEDEAIVAMDLEAQLTQMGYEVCACVDNGADAIAHARADRPALVLMDIVIKGGMDGIEAGDYIGATLYIPVLYLTAYSDDKTVERAAHTAPYGYLTKPFQPRELRAGIEVALFKSELQRRLRNSERWFAATLRCVGDAVVATDAEGRVRFMNHIAEALLGCKLEQASGHPISEVVRIESAADHTPLPSSIMRALNENAVIGIDFGSLLVGCDGQRIPVDDSAAPIRDEQGNLLGAVNVLHDVRARLAAEKRIRHSEERFRNAFNFAPGGMAIVSLDNHLLQVNTALCRLLGYEAGQLVDADLATFSVPEEALSERARQLELLSGHTSSEQFEKRFITRAGKILWTVVSASLLRQENEPLCFLLQIHDITERKEVEQRLAHLAHFDALTGLANRARLSEKIEHEITVARRYGRRLAVVFLDLDHFKQVNDSLGHEAGDDLLQVIAARLHASVRESDTVGRLGGDEFVIVLPAIEAVEDVLVVTGKVQVECGKPVQVAGSEVRVGVSLGVSFFPDDADDARTLLRYADSALYHAKEEGRNHLQFYRAELGTRVEERLRLEAGLRGALERNEFELYYQPIVSVDDSKPVAAEALIRWNHPQRGMLGPDDFMPLAEETGVSAAIGEWVIAQACRQAAEWSADDRREADAPALGVAVNVSASQFRSGRLVQVVRQALADTGLAPGRLCIEITEHLLLAASDRNRTIIAELKALGVRVAIDDFGTGYSSLAYISKFRPTELKIDRSLITGDAIEGDRAHVVVAAIAMAHSLKMELVSEGVETEAQQIFLKEQGCELAQGFYFARPCAAPAFSAWLQARAAADSHADRLA